MDAPLNRRILSGQAKGIPSNWVQDVVALHALEAGQDVGDGVDAQVAEVEGARGVWEHGQDVRRLGVAIMARWLGRRRGLVP